MTVMDIEEAERELDGVVLSGKDGTILLELVKRGRPHSCNTWDARVGTTDKEFRCVFKHENIALVLEQDYTIELDLKIGCAHFKAPDLQYWIPSER